MADKIDEAIEARKALCKGYGTHDEEKDKEILERKYILRGGASGQMDRDEKRLSYLIRKKGREIKENQSMIDNALNGLGGIKDGLIDRTQKAIKYLEKEILNLEMVRDLIAVAREFYHNASDKIKRDLDDRRRWSDYPEMAYYRKMKGMY